MSGSRSGPQTALETPERPPESAHEDQEPESRAGRPRATPSRGIERLEERLEGARTAVAAALGSAGERMRTAVPQSERVLDAGKTIWGRASVWLAPFFAWLARLFHPFWSFVHQRLFKSRRRASLSATLVVIAVLLATILPPLVTLASALSDYTSLRSLGEDGLRHLLAAKDDLTGTSSSSGSSGSTGASSSSASLTAASDALDQLNSFFLPPPDPTAGAPYRYLAQRQAGTDNAITVTVHPAPGMTKAGLGAKTFSATLDTNAIFAYGAQAPAPTPTPTPTTTTPSPSAATPGTTTQAGGTSPTRKADPQAAVADLRAANKDFSQLRNKLNSPDWILSAAGTLPGTRTSLTTVRALADVGYDITSMGLEFVDALNPVLQRIQGGALSGQTELVTPANLDALQHAVDHADGYLSDIENRLPVIDLSTMPITADQAATFSAAIELLPKMHDALHQLQPWVKALGWAIGVGGTRHYLVQTLDKAELRPSGGFTGEYGLLTITNGKLDPFAFKFADNLDYNYDAVCGCNPRPPDKYGWWPVGVWGLRDSNLSADFPTTAKINIDVIKKEGEKGGNDVFNNPSGGDVDGAIQFTTTAIAHILRVTGPLVIPAFKETVTADNLEDKLYYYQDVVYRNAPEQTRKQFLQAVTQVLQDTVKHLPANELLPLAKQAFDDMKAKDIQVYVTNSQIEDQLLKLGAGSAVDTRADIDGYLLDQANVSYNKATPCLQVTQNDDVTLDDKGGASHRLTITLFNDSTCPLLSLSSYTTIHDYVRIYVPPQARLIRGIGFDTGLPLCWTPPVDSPGAGKPGQLANVPYCPDNPYPDGELNCPAGAYGPGSVAPHGYGDLQPLDVLGPPPQTTTDLPGRGMWGGWVIIPKSCTERLQLRWYVPHIAHAG